MQQQQTLKEAFSKVLTKQGQALARGNDIVSEYIMLWAEAVR